MNADETLCEMVDRVVDATSPRTLRQLSTGCSNCTPIRWSRSRPAAGDPRR